MSSEDRDIVSFICKYLKKKQFHVYTQQLCQCKISHEVPKKIYPSKTKLFSFCSKQGPLTHFFTQPKLIGRKNKRCSSEQIILSMTSDSESETNGSNDDSLSLKHVSEWLPRLTHKKLPDFVHYRPFVIKWGSTPDTWTFTSAWYLVILQLYKS